MGKRGPKPKGKVNLKWTPELAYAVGLLVTDGSLSKNRRHITLVSKDLEQLRTFKKLLKLDVSIGYTSSGRSNKKYTRIQFGDVLFYRFLLSIGLIPNKSKVIGEVKVPKNLFFDFLRGHFDGDGCTYSYFDPRWKNSFMFYTVFVSASKMHIVWLQKMIKERLKITGHLVGKGEEGTVYQLKYAKADSLKLLRKMYYAPTVPSLSRKKLKIQKMLAIVGERL